MDLKKIFIKNAKPTKVGGQAVLDGIMMKGEKKKSLVMRLPDNSLYASIEKTQERKGWMKIPFIRGVGIFGSALVDGVKILTKSADILEKYEGEGELEEDKFTKWMNKKFGKEKAWDIMIYFAVAFSLVFTVGIFMILPTAAVSLCKYFTHNEVALNLIEGIVRIVLFVIYVLLISKMEDIKNVFRYHGAEHKTIHCFENGKELTVENCREFTTLHPRCGTSFLMFVLVISLILFSFLGWPNLFIRIVSRIVLLPVIAGLSYELLRWAGNSDNVVVKVLSIPGILLQKITTKEPTDKQLEVAIAAMKAAMREDGPIGSGLCDKDGNLVHNVRLLVKNGEKRLLDAGLSQEEAKSQSELFYCYLKKIDKSQLHLKSRDAVDYVTMKRFLKFIEKRKEGMPLQYITGEANFMDYTFKVNENVLIPRLDTEIVVDEAEKIIEQLGENRKILDLCTGSGVIGITLEKRWDNIQVAGSDISAEALKVAQKNKVKLNSNIEFIESDMFDKIEDKFDMIISNPPYIPSKEIEKLTVDVKDHEPMGALDGGIDGLDFYRQIAREGKKYLNDGGYIVLEIGHNQGADIVKLFEEEKGYSNIEIKNDLDSKERVAIVQA